MEQTQKQLIDITDLAVLKIKELLEQRDTPAMGIRVGVKQGGCSGLSYYIEYADEKDTYDEVIESGGVKVFIQPKAVMYLLGTQMDYMDTEIKSGFVFKNPNEKGKCGCGESFHV